jgi:hypothetical protein
MTEDCKSAVEEDEEVSILAEEELYHANDSCCWYWELFRSTSMDGKLPMLLA